MSAAAEPGVRMVPFGPALAADFRRLNVAWLERRFSVEPVDEVVFGAPETDSRYARSDVYMVWRDRPARG